MPGGGRDIWWLHGIPGHLDPGLRVMRGPGGSTKGRALSPWCQSCWGVWGQCTPSQHRAPSPDLHVLLLEDLLVLLQKQDEKLLLKCHSKTAVGSADSKQTFSPVLKLNAVLIRSVATGAQRAVATGLGWPGPPAPHSTCVSPTSPAPSKCRMGVGAQMTTDSLVQTTPQRPPGGLGSGRWGWAEGSGTASCGK